MRKMFTLDRHTYEFCSFNLKISNIFVFILSTVWLLNFIINLILISNILILHHKIFFSSRLVVQKSISSVLTHRKHGCWTNSGVCTPPDHPLVHTNSGNHSLWLSSSVTGWSTPWLIVKLLRSWCSAWSRSMERFALTLIILPVSWVSAFAILYPL